MSGNEMAEDRIYAHETRGVEAYVAAGVGVVVVSVSGNRVGRFQMDRRGPARDLAASADGLAVATDDDVLIGSPASAGRDDGDAGGDESAYHKTGFGPAVAVGFDAGDVVAADGDGRIARRVDGEWFDLATVDAAVRAIDGPLVAAADGVYRATPDGLDHVGLSDARDVAARGPYAATGEGLYELGNGWIRVANGRFDAVAATAARAHAAGDDLFARRDGRDGRWRHLDIELPGRVAGIAHAGDTCTYAVTEGGTALARAGARLGVDDRPGEGWRTRSLGVGDVRALAIPSAARTGAGADPAADRHGDSADA